MQNESLPRAEGSLEHFVQTAAQFALENGNYQQKSIIK